MMQRDRYQKRARPYAQPNSKQGTNPYRIPGKTTCVVDARASANNNTPYKTPLPQASAAPVGTGRFRLKRRHSEKKRTRPISTPI